jgi:hypothetical protein
MRVILTLPLKLKPEGNRREAWYQVAKRRKAEEQAVALSLRAYAPALVDQGFPLVCTLTRVSGGTLDSDNLQGAFKGVRDAVARELGIDDGGPEVDWQYRQERGPRLRHQIRIEIGPPEEPCRHKGPGVNAGVKSEGSP